MSSVWHESNTSCDLVERYNPRQFLGLVREYAGYKVPANTFRTWRRRIGIEVDPDGCYGEAEVRYMLEFLAFRSRGYTAKQYVDYQHGRFEPAPF